MAAQPNMPIHPMVTHNPSASITALSEPLSLSQELTLHPLSESEALVNTSKSGESRWCWLGAYDTQPLPSFSASSFLSGPSPRQLSTGEADDQVVAQPVA